jgi:hypothetical protein
VPPLTVENAGALIEGGGASAPRSKENNVQVKQVSVPEVQFTVERAFYYKGEPLVIGKTYSLPRNFAIEMQNANKGRIKVVEPVAAVVSDRSQQTPSAPERRAEPKEEKSDARK